MLKSILKFMFLLSVQASVFSQARKVIDRNLIIQKEFIVPDLKCIQGKKLIEAFIIRNEGVVEINTNISNKVVRVSFIKGLTTYEEIGTAISNTGYAADTFSSNKDARKFLPICCLDTFTENTVKMYYDQEREKFRKMKKRYREQKKFICCRSCDIVVKYRNLVK